MIDSESLLHKLENDLINFLVDKLENSEISKVYPIVNTRNGCFLD